MRKLYFLSSARLYWQLHLRISNRIPKEEESEIRTNLLLSLPVRHFFRRDKIFSRKVRKTDISPVSADASLPLH